MSIHTGFSSAVKAVIAERAQGRCEICGVDPVQEYHHRRPRAAGGTRRPETNLAAAGLGVCSSCHRMIESYRRVATMLGWLVPQNCDPLVYPVLYRGCWCFLEHDGGRRDVDADWAEDALF